MFATEEMLQSLLEHCGFLLMEPGLSGRGCPSKHIFFGMGKIMKLTQEVPETSPLTDTARSRRYSAVSKGVAFRPEKVFSTVWIYAFRRDVIGRNKINKMLTEQVSQHHPTPTLLKNCFFGVVTIYIEMKTLSNSNSWKLFNEFPNYLYPIVT